MKRLAMLSGTAAVVLLAGAANRAEAQLGFGTLRYGPGFGGSVTTVRGPFGGRVTSVQGPFGGGAVSVRGPFGGRVTSVRGPLGGGVVGVGGPWGGVGGPWGGVGGPWGGVGVVRPGIVPVVPPAVVPVPVPVPVVQQTALIPAVAPAFTYSAAYHALIPPGLATLEIASTPYFYTTLLPAASRPVVVGGANLFVSGGVYYQPYFLGNQTVYVVVPH
jgi:hypothetical protein